MTPCQPARKFHDGRDEMNLADFPISALQRQQPTDEHGRKLDRLEYEASRYDLASRQRVSQRVTLTSSARDGLPTPADEHVILALLYVAKHSHNFREPVVHFAPGQLFEIMGWAPNGRSYDRLKGVLRRLKGLTIRYENAWWDAAGRGYEEEVATGIISAYRIARQVSGPRKAGTPLQSWVTWTPQFHDSLAHGNLKRLDLDLFFRLRSPTAQRMYRFLDKRFYNSPRLAMDLLEFACGHIGLSETKNVAVLKRRLAPAIEDLEGVQFLLPAAAPDRYQKVKAGVWRVQFDAGPLAQRVLPAEAQPVRSTQYSVLSTPDGLARAFYQRWNPTASGQPGPRDLEQAEAILREHGAEQAELLLPCLVQVTRKEWPDCRSFSGAAQKYLTDALTLLRQQRRRVEQKRAAEASGRQEQEEAARRQQAERQLGEAWDALPATEQETVRQTVLARLGGAPAPEVFVRRLCLEELARRLSCSPRPCTQGRGAGGEG